MTAYVTEICSTCGNLRSVCSDPDGKHYPQLEVCYATAAREQAMRLLYKKHKHPEPDDGSPHFMDGVVLWMAQQDLTPDETFGGALGVLPAEQPYGEQDESSNDEQDSPEA